MKKIAFTNKKNSETKNVLTGSSSIGELVFPMTQSVPETNRAIQWCNNHKTVGDVYETELYKLEIV